MLFGFDSFSSFGHSDTLTSSSKVDNSLISAVSKMMGLFKLDKNKTFKPLKTHKGEKKVALHNYAKATLGSGDLKAAVALPEGESEAEWIAIHVTGVLTAVQIP